ncbi:glucokinase [Gluconacetobacter tumulicola]|uniref:Glucokinase n=1 Tax=Gluconacetobacter tumulicola TaxID=1017177 RepID=A0A7W4JBK5_9PROT|nr:glucokinase [Gluconacetobacter tumulicola]MBB2178206.1 glucokinase [Gluconacetobacter tumulicola]
MKEIVAVDIGGTHARFAIATVEAGRVTALGDALTLKCAEHASLQLAWEAFGRQIGRALPRAAGIAVACPVQGDILKLTNNPWMIRPAQLGAQLGVDEHVLVNDFGAIGYAVAQVDATHLRHLCGPDRDLPANGVTTIVGPGTGLGSAYVVRRDGRCLVCETEGGHVDFAPLDSVDDRILQRLRQRYRRVSAERIVSGPGLVNLYETIAELEGQPTRIHDDKELWTLGLERRDPMASAAVERFCLALGGVAGDLALAQGANGVVIAGGVGLRLADHLPRSGFAERFVAKGRFESMMAGLPVKLITHPQPGLLGAAAAFAERFH